MASPDTRKLMLNAWRAGAVIPAFNIPYLPMVAPVVRALRDANSFGLIAVARCEWEKFRAGSPRAVRDAYERAKDERHTRLHLDHVPVVDEDGARVDFEAILADALDAGYESVMVDGSRLPLDENIAATRRVVELARPYGVPVEAELGAVLGHEAEPQMSYEEIIASGKGFTDPAEAKRFIAETGADWLSVAIGNIHGAIAPARRDQEKIHARLDIEHLRKISLAADVPLVLHGGSGIPREDVLAAVRDGIAKINIGTAIRQAYEKGAAVSEKAGADAVYRAVVAIVREELEIEGAADFMRPLPDDRSES